MDWFGKCWNGFEDCAGFVQDFGRALVLKLLLMRLAKNDRILLHVRETRCETVFHENHILKFKEKLQKIKH